MLAHFLRRYNPPLLQAGFFSKKTEAPWLQPKVMQVLHIF
jgi:protoheme ferro-lyase